MWWPSVPFSSRRLIDRDLQPPASVETCKYCTACSWRCRNVQSKNRNLSSRTRAVNIPIERNRSEIIISTSARSGRRKRITSEPAATGQRNACLAASGCRRPLTPRYPANQQSIGSGAISPNTTSSVCLSARSFGSLLLLGVPLISR